MPFEPHPTDPNSVIYKVNKYHLPKPWKGLTESERAKLWKEVHQTYPHCSTRIGKYGDLVEALLKEKNT